MSTDYSRKHRIAATLTGAGTGAIVTPSFLALLSKLRRYNLAKKYYGLASAAGALFGGSMGYSLSQSRDERMSSLRDIMERKAASFLVKEALSPTEAIIIGGAGGAAAGSAYHRAKSPLLKPEEIRKIMDAAGLGDVKLVRTGQQDVEYYGGWRPSAKKIGARKGYITVSGLNQPADVIDALASAKFRQQMGLAKRLGFALGGLGLFGTGAALAGRSRSMAGGLLGALAALGGLGLMTYPIYKGEKARDEILYWMDRANPEATYHGKKSQDYARIAEALTMLGVLMDDNARSK